MRKKVPADEIWLAARSRWDERYGNLIAARRNWRLAFLAMSGIAFLMGLQHLAELHRSHVVPFVIAVDRMNNVIATGLAEETRAVDPRIIRASIQQYVTNARSVSSDPEVLKFNLQSVFADTVVPSAANTLLKEYYTAFSPFEAADKATVQVAVHNVTPLSKSSYEVDWTETKRDRMGNLIDIEAWKGVFGIVISPPKDEAAMRVNAFGIYVYSITWSKNV
jgi:type IV secretion system protein VirB5